MMKKFLCVIAVLLLSVGILAGCAEPAQPSGETAAPTQAPETTTEAAGPELVSSWIGSHHTTNAMGDVVSGHLLNFYQDGTVKIYYGIKAGMQGHHYGSYDGTWTEDGTVSYSYYRESEDGWIDGEFAADFSQDAFRAKIFCMASFPNSSGGGIAYVRIDPVEPIADAEYIYGGSRLTDGGAFAALIQLKDGVLTGSAAGCGKTGSFGGAYEVVYSGVTDIDTPDRLHLRYPVLSLGENAVLSEGEPTEGILDFNDTSYIFCQLASENEVFPRIPMAAIVSQDGSRHTA